MSVYLVRAFVKLREVLSTNRELARRFEQLESRLDSKLTEHDEAIAAILSAIRELMIHDPTTPFATASFDRGDHRRGTATRCSPQPVAIATFWLTRCLV